MDEARVFFRKVRAMDRSVYHKFAADTEMSYVDTHIYAAMSLASPADKLTFNDYVNIEKIMAAWYKAGKLQ